MYRTFVIVIGRSLDVRFQISAELAGVAEVSRGHVKREEELKTEAVCMIKQLLNSAV
jgi:hypothetical protein